MNNWLEWNFEVTPEDVACNRLFFAGLLYLLEKKVGDVWLRFVELPLDGSAGVFTSDQLITDRSFLSPILSVEK